MMPLYSRNFLLSLRFWWKVPVRCGSQLTSNREGTLKPLSSSVFEALKTVGILRLFRGQRGGQLRSSSRFSSSLPSSKSEVLANVVDLHKTSSASSNIQDHTQASTTLKQLGILVLRSTRGNRAGRLVQERRTGLLSMQSISVQISEREPAQKHQRTHVPANCVTIQTLSTAPSCATPSILLTNAYHLSNKIEELRCVTDVNDTTIAIITESWLSNDIPTTAISLKENYNTYRKDRVNRYGGGVVAYIKSDIK